MREVKDNADLGAWLLGGPAKPSIVHEGLKALRFRLRKVDGAGEKPLGFGAGVDTNCTRWSRAIGPLSNFAIVTVSFSCFASREGEALKATFRSEPVEFFSDSGRSP
jgi:hypothetical protein